MTKIKICGLTNIEDVLAAVQLKVDYLGFIFYTKSPRFASPEFVARANKIIPSNIKKVGVFVNAPKCVINIYQRELKLDIVQLHGDEDESIVQYLATTAWKAVHIKEMIDIDEAIKFPADKLVIDSRTDDKYGGTGMVCDWQLAKKIAEQRDVFLAGGITPENVEKAINIVKPFGIDISSGIEEEAGKKDHQKLFNLVRKIRSLNI